jgi:hypothetical protein
MARLVAAFGASHSIMLYCDKNDWKHKFVDRDRTLPLYDDKGARVSYDDLLNRAGASSEKLFNLEAMEKRFDETNQEMDKLGDEIVAAKLDVLIVVGDDQEELFDDSNIPAIGIYCDDTIRNAPKEPIPEGDWQGVARMKRREEKEDFFYPCHKPLALHLTMGLVEQGFDVAAIKKLNKHQFEGHAYSFIHKRLLNGRSVPIIPVFVNTYYPPNQVTPKRSIELGTRMAELIKSFPEDLRVGIIASGGLSHFVVDERLDKSVIDAIKRKDLNFLANIDPKLLQAGSSEIRNWMVVAATAQNLGLELSRTSYIPGYRTPALTGIGICFAKWQ